MRCRHTNFVTRYRHGESKARLMRANDLKVQKKGGKERDSDGSEKKIMERKKRHREKESENCERWIR